jgi:hypothetical protein
VGVALVRVMRRDHGILRSPTCRLRSATLSKHGCGRVICLKALEKTLLTPDFASS